MAQEAGTTFVGRERELGLLLAALDEAQSGRGRLVLLSGEPGIGKSRLADELATASRARGHHVLWGRAWEDAGAPPYWPWIQALRFHIRSTVPATLRRQVGAGAGDIAQMLPELRELFTDLPDPQDARSDSARFQLFDSTTTLLRRVADVQPLLIVLDDLHAADTASVLLLRFVASQLTNMPVLLVGTYRDLALTPDHPLTSAIDEVAREPGTRTLRLAGLEADAVGRFIRAMAPEAVPDHLVSAVGRATSGNPLFVSEAIRLLSSEGRLEVPADHASIRVAVPASVRSVIARRVAYLSEGTVRALGLAAAIGPEFRVDVLSSVAETTLDVMLETVDEAVKAGLLQPVTGGPGRYRFAHDLIRETLHDDLSPGRRARLHRRIADVLETVYAASTDTHLAQLAYHYGEAAQGLDAGLPAGDPGRAGPKAIAYARRAGDQAARAHAYEEAGRMFRMVLTGLDRSDAVDERERTEILLALGEARARAGALDDARATFLDAADIAKRTGSGVDLARAALGFGGRHQWARPGSDTQLIPLLQDALVMLGGDDERLRAALLTRLACAWRSTPERRGESATLSRQAVDTASRLDDPDILIYCLAGQFWATYWPENPEVRVAIATEMLGVAEAAGDGERTADAHLMLFLSLTERGRIAEAHTELRTLSRLVEELRQPAQLWLGPVNRTWLALLEGDYPTAEALNDREMANQHPVTPAHDDISAARMHRFLLRREQGRMAAEESTVRASIVEFPWYPVHVAALVCLLLDVGREAEARTIFTDLGRDGFRAIYPDNEWLLAMGFVSEGAARLRDVAAAATLYERLAPYAGRHAIGHSEGSIGAVDRYLGLLAATIDRLDDAVQHLTAAIEVNASMGARPWVAHSEHDLAEVLRHRDAPGDVARAGELDRSASATAAALGMALADRIVPGIPVAPSVAASAEAPTGGARFVREGEYWTVEFANDTFRARDSKGMRHLARLLAAPGREIHALDLASPASSAARTVAPVSDASLSLDAADGTGAILDAAAKAAYRERLGELREDLAEAEAWNDPERAARAQAEVDALTHELAAAIGLGGRDRVASSSAERARISVTRAIRAALGRIGEQSGTLSSHLDATIHTGTFCSYTPDPRAPIAWQVGPGDRTSGAAP